MVKERNGEQFNLEYSAIKC